MVAISAAASILLLLGARSSWLDVQLAPEARWARLSQPILLIPLLVMAVLIAVRGVRTAGTTMLALALALYVLNSAIIQLPIILGGEPEWLVIFDALTGFAAAATFLRSTQLFPRPLDQASLRSPELGWRRLPWLAPLLARLLVPWAMWAVAGAWTVAAVLLPWQLAALANVAVMALGAANWWFQVRSGSRAVRNRVGWLLHMVVAFAATYVVTLALLLLLESAGVGPASRPYLAIGYSMVLAIAGAGSLAMAVFGAGAFNPALVMRSTVIYGAAISLLLFALNVITGALVDVAAGALGIGDRLVAATLGAIAGLLLEPVARSLRRLSDRFVPAAGRHDG